MNVYMREFWHGRILVQQELTAFDRIRLRVSIPSPYPGVPGGQFFSYRQEPITDSAAWISEASSRPDSVLAVAGTFREGQDVAYAPRWLSQYGFLAPAQAALLLERWRPLTLCLEEQAQQDAQAVLQVILGDDEPWERYLEAAGYHDTAWACLPAGRCH